MTTAELKSLFKEGGYSVEVEDVGLLRVRSEETGEDILVGVDRAAATGIDFRTLVSSQKFELVTLDASTLRAARSSTRSAVATESINGPGVNGLWKKELRKETSRAVAAAESIAQNRLAKVRARIQEVHDKATEGDLAAQGTLARLRRARRALDEQRRDNSVTLRAEARATSIEGVPKSSTNNYDNALSKVNGWLAEDLQGRLDPTLIKGRIADLNAELNHGVALWDGSVGSQGRYRETGTGVWARRVVGRTTSPPGFRPQPKKIQTLSYPPGSEVDGMITSFTEWFVEADLKVQQGEMTAIELAGRSHQSLVSIHPFIDGNGRTARMFMDWVLKRHGLETCTFVGWEELNVVFFVDRFNRNVPLSNANQKTPDEAVSAVANGVGRTVGILESALDGD